MEGEDIGCGTAVLRWWHRNPTMNAKSLAWESRVRRINDGSGTEEKQKDKLSTTK